MNDVTTDIKRNVLSSLELIHLSRWVGDNIEACKNLKYAARAAKAEAALGFKVTEANVVNIETVLKIPGPRVANRARADRVAILAAHVQYLFAKLGEPVPADLDDIVNRKAVDLG